MSSVDAIDAVRTLTERLVRIPSVSPDREAETACARAVEDALPTGIEKGSWETPDGRPVVWARVPGRARGGMVLLGHYDTVGTSDYAPLAVDGDARLAHDPERLRARLLELAGAGMLDAAGSVRGDLEEEAVRPGTWMFGRGALDMKSGLAAGIHALRALAAAPAARDVWFIATPDEEHESAGMLTAVQRLARVRDDDGVPFAGAVNLDYGEEPVTYRGMLGKALAGLWVAGVPAHASRPHEGVDAIQLAADVVSHVARDEALRSRLAAPPVALRMRDQKTRYDVQTAAEVVVELNLMLESATLREALRALVAAVERAVREHERHAARERGHAPAPASVRVAAWPDVSSAASRKAAEAGAASPGRSDLRQIVLDHVRAQARSSGLQGPAIVVFAQPPYYPSGPARPCPLMTVAEAVMREAGGQVRDAYPHISDACYLRWDERAAEGTEALPGFGDLYRLPVDAMRTLDLDVVNLGPWGRDAHGPFERVHAPYAFGRLPGLIEAVVRRTLSEI